ncbi:MAG: hypothetical protein CFE23_06050 [Flavobacterium sp. BFFFF1]|uniref:DUF6252 family protein n=1 Tax=unclassified Flavobacterium TaxID=196869 RepID=UPI000BD9B674|nr:MULTISPECIES: DUF6252 family protein [unclassified Flavobacterium]OYU81054.1 MAG: hypothetical protein CFE23_06050 [Flavobacterium sp. BFFFF1]
MKKIVSLLLILVAFSSCETDVKFSDPGLQGRKDNFIWRADLTQASFEATDPAVDPNVGNLTILGFRGLEIVSLQIPFDFGSVIGSSNPETYRFGYDNAHPENDDDMVVGYSYQDNGLALEYYTGTGFNVDAQERGNAQVTITEYDPIAKEVSGNFKFNVKYQGDSDIVPENVNFQEGAFYRVKIY